MGTTALDIRLPLKPSELLGLRVLLIEPNKRLRSARAQKLLAAGYRVSALADPGEAPRVVPLELYNVIVVSVKGRHRSSLHRCKQLGRIGNSPALVLLSDSVFTLDARLLPALVISEKTEKAAEEKLLAFLDSRRHPSTTAPTHVH